MATFSPSSPHARNARALSLDGSRTLGSFTRGQCKRPTTTLRIPDAAANVEWGFQKE
jgi:hypothetical protein